MSEVYLTVLITYKEFGPRINTKASALVTGTTRGRKWILEASSLLNRGGGESNMHRARAATMGG